MSGRTFVDTNVLIYAHSAVRFITFARRVSTPASHLGFLVITKSPLVPYTCGTSCRRSSQARPQPAPGQSACGRTGRDGTRAASSALTHVLPRTAACLLAGALARPSHPRG